MSRKPWFPFWVDDFWQDESVQAMSLEEVGLYLRLLSHQWREGSIPSDTDRLARICNLDASDMARLWPSISQCFKQVGADQDRLANPRLLAIWEGQTTVHQRLSERGRKGAQARWHKHTSANAQAIPKESPVVVKGESESETTTDPPSPPAGGTERAGESTDSQDGTAATGSVSGSPKRKSGGKKRRKPTTPPPETFEPSKGNTEWFRKGFGVVAKSMVDRETQQFLDRHRSKGNEFVDWQAAWRTWMSNWQTNFGKTSPPGSTDRQERANPNLVTPDDDG